MASFYSQADQDIYQSGNRFIPQEQYRLGPYTPPGIMGQNTNAGIASTNLAQPYKWPPEGGGEGAGNISGTQQRPWNPNQNLGPTNITDYEAEADDVGSTWGGSLARLQDLYSKLPTPGNLIKKGIDKYQAYRATEEEEKAKLTAITRSRAINKMKEKYKDPNYIPPTTGGGGDIIQTPPTNGGTTGGYEPANVGQQTSTDRADWGYDPFAQGGRIGYQGGELVEEDVMMASDPNAMDSLNEMSIQIFGKGVHELSEEEYQMLVDMANDQAAGPEQDQGLASLV